MRRLACLCISLAFLTSTAFAGSIARVGLGGETRPLKGAVAFCEAIPSRCKPHKAAIVVYTDENLAELKALNDDVNKEITFEEEPTGVDIWQDRNFSRGDCEDYALLKRVRLIERGWPAGALRIGIVTREKEDPAMHAILIVSTDRGDFVLDIPGKTIGMVRAWNPKEFYELNMIWGADAKWYLLEASPVIVVGSKK